MNNYPCNHYLGHEMGSQNPYVLFDFCPNDFLGVLVSFLSLYVYLNLVLPVFGGYIKELNYIYFCILLSFIMIRFIYTVVCMGILWFSCINITFLFYCLW